MKQDKLESKVLPLVQTYFPKVYKVKIINNKYVKCFTKEQPTLFDFNLFDLETEFYTANLDFWLKLLKE